MPLFDHLGELRRRLMICVVCLVIAACVLYMVTPQIVQFFMVPIQQYLGDETSLTGGALIATTPLEGFTIRFKVAFFSAFIVCAPLVLWEFMAFFLPALKPNERKWVIPTFAVGVFLFFLGEVFCYYIILDPAFAWMIAQSNDIATVLPDVNDYIKLVMLFEIGFGIAFELPLVVFYLIVFNIVPYKKLRHSWRTVYIVLMVICACVTPDASPVTMLLMFGAMVALYELSLFVSRIVLSKRITTTAADETDIEEMMERTGLSREQLEKSAQFGDKEKKDKDGKADRKAKKSRASKKKTAEETDD